MAPAPVLKSKDGGIAQAELTCPTPKALDTLREEIGGTYLTWVGSWVNWVEKGLSIGYPSSPSDTKDTSSMVQKARNVLVHAEDCKTPKSADLPRLTDRTWTVLNRLKPLIDNPISITEHFERSWPLMRSMLSLSREGKDAARNLAIAGLGAIKILKNPKEFAKIVTESKKVSGDKPDYNQAGTPEFEQWRNESNAFYEFMDARFGVTDALGGVPGILFRRALAAKDEAGRQAILTAYEKIATKVLADLQ